MNILCTYHTQIISFLRTDIIFNNYSNIFFLTLYNDTNVNYCAKPGYQNFDTERMYVPTLSWIFSRFLFIG